MFVSSFICKALFSLFYLEIWISYLYVNQGAEIHISLCCLSHMKIFLYVNQLFYNMVDKALFFIDFAYKYGSHASVIYLT